VEGRWNREQLPDAIGVPRSPGAVGDEAQLKQTLEALVDLGAGEAQALGHASATVEGSAVTVRGQGQEHQHGDALAAQTREPAVLEQAVLEPPEGTRGAAEELGIRGRG